MRGAAVVAEADPMLGDAVFFFFFFFFFIYPSKHGHTGSSSRSSNN